MTTKTFTVPAINCSHCTHTIELEVGELAGVQRVTADEETKEVTVEWDGSTSWDAIKELLSEIDFPPEEA
ncbi:MAG: heavy metal-associated domain-containing protein [Chloroflexota bacterium]